MLANKTALGYEIKIPRVFDKYRVIEYINCGSFSVAYKVLDQWTHEFYCAKIASMHDMQNLDSLDSMKKEVSILEMIDHPNVIKCYGSFTIKNENGEEFFVIITELCSFGNLYDYIYDHRNDISTEDARFFVRSIIEAVWHIHSLGIAHCDIKPGNILLDDQLNPKLCDFNLSKNVRETEDTTCGGTFPYMAPEIRSGCTVDFFKADIFSLGITIYEISERHLPFRKDSEGNLILCISTNDEELKEIVEKCTREEQKARVAAVFLLDEPFLDCCEDISYDKSNQEYDYHRHFDFDDEYDYEIDLPVDYKKRQMYY